jgi:hypothetical protein
VAWFDDIWKNDWDKEASDIPPGWTTRLPNIADRERWVPLGNSTTNCHLLVVRRIVQSKFTITINNVHPKYYAWLDLNDDKSSSPISNPMPNTGPVIKSDILAGTRAALRRATDSSASYDSTTKVYQVQVNDNITFNIQP